jgi:hypothetical protein
MQVFEGTLRRLVEYSWPGNVRELQNVIERGVILSPTNLLVLDREFSLAGDEPRRPPSLSLSSRLFLVPLLYQHFVARGRAPAYRIRAGGYKLGHRRRRRREDFGRSSEYVTPHEKTKHPAAGRSAYERRADLRGQKPLPRGNRQRALNALFSTLHSNGSSPTLRSMKIIAARSIADARRLSETFDESTAVV